MPRRHAYLWKERDRARRAAAAEQAHLTTTAALANNLATQTQAVAAAVNGTLPNVQAMPIANCSQSGNNNHTHQQS
ncbi:hypothetical protein BD410DRAFT_786442 [Rickenella mellea]|uniref:Uncharacterized protein n=1 Tax=Rickenella mellea TaxID=50990 RepID=A0A4Y7QAC8_9AGAM|nr:hypothetical protein BD410DRAFT_786442 [Rickenella mellea]